MEKLGTAFPLSRPNYTTGLTLPRINDVAKRTFLVQMFFDFVYNLASSIDIPCKQGSKWTGTRRNVKCIGSIVPFHLNAIII